jgi:uncharacterized protein
VVTDERRQEYTEVCNSVVGWARGRADMMGVAVVGSWARSEPRMDSDIDLVILTTDKAAFTLDEDWVSVAVSQPAELVRTQEWGPLTERRIRVASGLEIEFGFAPPNWAETDPVDPGTAGVVSDGCTPMLDPGELLHKLIHAGELKMTRVARDCPSSPDDGTLRHIWARARGLIESPSGPSGWRFRFAASLPQGCRRASRTSSAQEANDP